MNTQDFIIIFSNPTITVIIGAIVGGLASLLPLYSIQHNKDAQFKKNIRRLVKTELEYYRSFLEEIISKGIVHPTKSDIICIAYGSEMAKKMNQMMADMYNNRFSPQNYPKLTIETKAMAFDENNLIDLEETYYHIMTFNYAGSETVNHTGNYLFIKHEVQQLIDEIRKTERKI